MKKLAIIGSNDLGQLIAYHAINDAHFDVVGFFDDFASLNDTVLGIPILGKTDLIEDFFLNGVFDFLIVGIGYNHMRIRKVIFETLKGKVPFGNVIHSSSYVDSSVILGVGIFILPGCTIDKDVIIGDNVLLNTSVVIAHDTIIESHCFLAPAVNIAGKVHIKECCIIGIGSTIIDNIIIHSMIQIGGGTVVINDLTSSGLYVGIPAKIKKKFNT
jgi:sugar O-acyltransferase (sialic acid O-acetyltransferase NeuD family)